MDDRTVRGPRLLRGMVTAGLSTLLIAVGHVLAGGAVPDLTVLVVLFPLLTAALVGVADHCRSTTATIVTLGAGQLALHVLLGLLHPHAHTAADPVAMVAAHAAATLVVAVFLRQADQALTAAGAALRRMLPRRPFVPPADGPLRPLRVAGPARALRSLTLVAVPARIPRRPVGTSCAWPPSCPPHRTGNPMIGRFLARLVVAGVVACVALLLGAAPAFAHTRLESSNPADGASISAAPEAVSLTFSEDIDPGFATITVVGPDGTSYQTGAVTGDGPEVRTAVSPLGPAGPYEIGYRVVSDDGHPVSGKVAFTLTAPGPAAAAAPTAAPEPTAAAAPAVTPQANAQQSEGAPVWPWILGAVVLVGAGAVTALRLARRS